MFYLDLRSQTPAEERVIEILRNRKAKGLTQFDTELLLYLLFLSRRRLLIPFNSGSLSEHLGQPYGKVTAAIRKLSFMDLVKRVKRSEHSYLIVSPLLINNGNVRKKAFKVKVWNES